MFERVLKLFRERIATRRFVLTLHAVEELEADRLSIYDLEQAILTGKITHRQRDENSGEWKYVVRGRTVSHDEVVVVAKLSATDKLVIITIYGEADK